MNEQEIISSGLLELYVAGALPPQDILIVEGAIKQYPSVLKEVEAIELSLMQLSEATGGPISPSIWDRIAQRTSGVRSYDTPPKKSLNWTGITGWAAAILCFAGLFWMIKQHNELKEKVRYTNTQNVVLEEQLQNSESLLTETTAVLDIIRSKDYQAISLPGNVAVSPSSFATVYYNKNTNVAYIDAKGLPEPPEGKVYQVWSLVMNPLTPSSIGVLDGFDVSENKFFKVENIPTPEAFGITLEPEGGSESPTLDQLYTLGMVAP